VATPLPFPCRALLRGAGVDGAKRGHPRPGGWPKALQAVVQHRPRETDAGAGAVEVVGADRRPPPSRPADRRFLFPPRPFVAGAL